MISTISVCGVKLTSLDSDAGVPVASSSWLEPCWFLNIQINFLSYEGDSLGLLPDISKVVTHLNNLHLCKIGLMILESAVVCVHLQFSNTTSQSECLKCSIHSFINSRLCCFCLHVDFPKTGNKTANTQHKTTPNCAP